MKVGLDIGGTKTHAVAIDAAGRVVGQLRLPTGFGAAAVLATAIEAVSRLASALDVGISQFNSVGVGIPGTVDGESGRVTHAVNLGVADLDLGRDLALQLGVFVRVENDVNAAAVGAFHLLGRSNMHSMAYLNLGTGLAAGLVLDGRLWRGSRGTAGEIGHIPVDPSGALCPCGQRGCLELMASGSAIVRQWPTNHPRPAQALFIAAAAGDKRAIEVRHSLLSHVASAVRVLVLSLDVDTVVIGGGLSSLGPPLLLGVREVLDGWTTVSPFIASLELAGRVTLVPEGFSVAAVGAALVGVTPSEVV